MHETRLKDANAGDHIMRYRPLRGTLEDAMEEVVEVDGRLGLIEHLRKTHPPHLPLFDETSVEITPYGGDDDRIGWRDVHLVKVNGFPAGFCEGDGET